MQVCSLNQVKSTWTISLVNAKQVYYKQNLSTEWCQNGVLMDCERQYPNPKPDHIQGILEALLAEIDFYSNVKNKIQKM